MRYYVTILSLLITFCSYSQITVELRIPLLDRADKVIKFKHDFLSSKRFTIQVEKQCSLTGEFLNELGEIKNIQFVDSLKLIKVIGQYSPCTDTLIKEILIQQFDGEMVYELLQYITPHPTGLWFYYDLLKNKTQRKYFNNGIEVFNKR